jgi:hypothetical protein
LEQKELDLGEEPGCAFWEQRAWPAGGGADGATEAFASARPGAVADWQQQPPKNLKKSVTNLNSIFVGRIRSAIRKY